MRHVIAFIPIIASADSSSKVFLGLDVSIKCAFGGTSSLIPVWSFNEEVISGGSFVPEEIGLDNVRIDDDNDSISYLLVDDFVRQNEGIYTCSFGKEEISTYNLTSSRKDNHYIMRLQY